MDTNDLPIMATAEDAILAKRATVQTGYYEDPFLEPFAKKALGNTRRRQFQPIIKRGTHARVCCMDRAISQFLRKNNSDNQDCQIVVLGAGKDTSYFRYRSGYIMGMEQQQNSNGDTANNREVHWYEVDHKSVIQEKYKIITDTPELASLCTTVQQSKAGSGGGGFSSSGKNGKYHLIQHDLRDDPLLLVQKLNLKVRLPTLFLLECVFMYLPNQASKALLTTLSTSVEKAWIVGYEPILGSDPFGRIMQQNLVRARVATPFSCLLQTRTLQAHLEKLVEGGFSRRAVACDMWSAYETILTNDQRRRANKSELLDEVEEWILIMRHYCFFAARGGNQRDNDDDDTNEWTRVGPESPLGFLPEKCLEFK